jgi:hypothetical protein
MPTGGWIMGTVLRLGAGALQAAYGYMLTQLAGDRLTWKEYGKNTRVNAV